MSAPAFANDPGNTNDVTYWQAQYPGTDCFKDTGGSIVGKDVVLTVTDAVVLIVNGGSNDQVYPNPVAGQTGYHAPLNNGGQIPDVSHWIYCSPVKTVPLVASASTHVDGATCTTGVKVTWDSLVNAVGSPAGGVVGPFTGNIVATAINGAKFAAGDGVSADGTTLTIPLDLVGPRPDCTTPKDATASEQAGSVATCDGPSTVTFSITNATWGDAVNTSGNNWTRTATADQGHEFADGTSTATVSYTITPKLAAGSEACTPTTPTPSATPPSTSVPGGGTDGGDIASSVHASVSTAPSNNGGLNGTALAISLMASLALFGGIIGSRRVLKLRARSGSAN
jgi:hypothetical protein